MFYTLTVLRDPEAGLTLGCIADDFTGAGDVAGVFAGQGLSVVMTIGPPDSDRRTPAGDVDAVVVALKTRTAPVTDAVDQSRTALQALRTGWNPQQILFKYCSTFDSTDDGNIGPVADALADEMGSALTIVCPAYPENSRTIYNGHLFVGDRLLEDSGMATHPLTPMRDSDLVRVLARQTERGVGLVPLATVEKGTEAIAERLADLQRKGARYAVTDAVAPRHLDAIGGAAAGQPLVTGAAGIGRSLARSHARTRSGAPAMDAPKGPAAILAGSCSKSTLAQVDLRRRSGPAMKLDPRRLASDSAYLPGVMAWAADVIPQEAPLIYSCASNDDVATTQQLLGPAESGDLIEKAFSRLAAGLVELGVRTLVVAGGETAGAVVTSLGIGAVAVGPEIEPGVPWMLAEGPKRKWLVLKSGNFGSENFFDRVLSHLDL